MFYRETGQFKTSYMADEAMFPIRQDLWGILAILFVAFFAIPFFGNEYLLGAIMIPILIFSLAALGLNILLGYAGLLSLGSGAFMAVGCYTAWNVLTRLPELPLPFAYLAGGLVAALVGILFGLPSLRIKGFYLAVATLALQFFAEWVFTHIGWLYGYSPQGSITFPTIELFGFQFDTPETRYLFILTIVVGIAFLCKNMVRTRTGRDWMAIRDMDIAAEVIGIPLLRTKLLAFAVSSFILGIAGALWGQTFLVTLETDTFGLVQRSFPILFMVIIGGLGSIMGSFIGAAFIVLTPILTSIIGHSIFAGIVTQRILSTMEVLIFGAVIIFFIIVEPLGFARMWQIFKGKLQVWPFPPR